MSGSTMVLAPTVPPNSIPTAMSLCSHCGHDLPTAEEAYRRIKDLEAQVKLLNTKAAAAVDKMADYEDEIKSLRASSKQLQQSSQPQPQTIPPKPIPSALRQASAPTIPSSAPTSEQQRQLTPSPAITPPVPLPNQQPISASPPRPTTSRLASLSSFLPGRKRDTVSLPTQTNPSTPINTLFPGFALTETPPRLDANALPATDPSALQTLQVTLETERRLRLRAETSLTETQSELEELTATLFGQANEMVATERRARAKLEERVKVLEDRDGEKRGRLERLERAMERIERVRDLIGKEARNHTKDDGKVKAKDSVDEKKESAREGAVDRGGNDKLVD